MKNNSKTSFIGGVRKLEMREWWKKSWRERERERVEGVKREENFLLLKSTFVK